MAEFGMPYMGSKGTLAKWVLQKIPKQENIYDLFGGGFAISHCAVLSKKWNTVHYNEIQKDLTELVTDAIKGKYSYERFKPEWIPRFEFHRRKSAEAYIRYIWSFGNNGKTYMFGPEVEPLKRSMHQAVVFGEFDEAFKSLFGFDTWKDLDSIRSRRHYLRSVIKHFSARKKPAKFDLIDQGQLQQLERIERLQQVENLVNLERLQILEGVNNFDSSLKITSLDYREVEIRKESVIYCDPPYVNTAGYNDGGFNHEEFYSWIRSSDKPIYISEYFMPEDFKVIASMSKAEKMSSNKANAKVFFEMIYANKIGWELYNDTQQGIVRPKSKIRKK